MKISFNFGAFVFLTFFIIIITSPNQFTKELIYRKNDTVVYDSNHKKIGKISQQRENGENVLNVEYKDLTQSLINSTIATEDATFFRHNGVDYLNTVENGFKTLVLRSIDVQHTLRLTLPISQHRPAGRERGGDVEHEQRFAGLRRRHDRIRPDRSIL